MSKRGDTLMRMSKAHNIRILPSNKPRLLLCELLGYTFLISAFQKGLDFGYYAVSPTGDIYFVKINKDELLDTTENIHDIDVDWYTSYVNATWPFDKSHNEE